MNTVTECANAKINLTLDIVGESGGFHLLDMLVCDVALADEVTITERTDNKVQCTMDGVEVNVENSAVRAAEFFIDTFKTHGFDIEIKKGIPFAGGLGGSSADAAAVIRAAVRLFGLPENKVNPSLLITLGSDVPCMYYKGVKRVRGIGEKLDFIDIDLPYKVGFIAGSGVDTALAYRTFDTLKLMGGNATAKLIADLDKNYFDIANYLSNDLFIPAVTINPNVQTACDKIMALLPRAIGMSGSGSTVFGLFKNAVPDELSKTTFKK